MESKDQPANALRTMQEKPATREFAFDRRTLNEDARTIELAFASEAPYQRYWGIEILDCSEKAMDLARLRSGGNLLCDHDWRDVVGVVETVTVGADRVARAVVRFGKSARASEIWQDVVDGIRRSVSVGYQIHDAIPVKSDEGEAYRVIRWEPLEISFVAVPADAGVGVGRSATPDATIPQIVTKEKTMDTQTVPAVPAAATDTRNHAQLISAAATQEPRLRDVAMSSIQAGHTVEQFQNAAIKHLSTLPTPTSDVGMSQKEVKRYSMLRALHALANPNDKAAQDAAAFERECSNAAAQILGKTARGLMLPSEIQRRDLVAGTGNAGGFTVQTDLRAQDFITMLRNAMVVDKLGVRMLTGLQGNIAIPKQSGAGTAYWVAENAPGTESQKVLAQVSMTPKTITAFTDISRRLLIQSSIDVEQMVQEDLSAVLGLGIQQAVINGSGASNQPSGIMTQVTSTIIGGTNGAAPTWANVIGMETAVSVANAQVDKMGYLTNAKVRGTLKTTQKFASTNGMPVWADTRDNPLNGYQAAVTNAVPSNLTKGSASGICSAILFGNFADVIVGLWGGMDMIVDPYTGSAAGTVRVVMLQDADVALRNVESFATMVDALTP